MIGWGTPEQVAIYVGRPTRTIRTWAQRGLIPVACDASTRRVIVHAGTTRKYADQRAVLTSRAS